jgi:hypothetical protein
MLSVRLVESGREIFLIFFTIKKISIDQSISQIVRKLMTSFLRLHKQITLTCSKIPTKYI